MPPVADPVDDISLTTVGAVDDNSDNDREKTFCENVHLPTLLGLSVFILAGIVLIFALIYVMKVRARKRQRTAEILEQEATTLVIQGEQEEKGTLPHGKPALRPLSLNLPDIHVHDISSKNGDSPPELPPLIRASTLPRHGHQIVLAKEEVGEELEEEKIKCDAYGYVLPEH